MASKAAVRVEPRSPLRRSDAGRRSRRPEVDRQRTGKRQGRSLAEARDGTMRRLMFLTAIAIGCQQAPVTTPRILSVQTPAGMPPPPSLKTTRTTPLIVPTAPVGTRPGVVAPPMIMAPAPTPPPGAIAPPAGVMVPAAPGGVQGVAPPNTF